MAAPPPQRRAGSSHSQFTDGTTLELSFQSDPDLEVRNDVASRMESWSLRTWVPGGVALVEHGQPAAAALRAAGRDAGQLGQLDAAVDRLVDPHG